MNIKKFRAKHLSARAGKIRAIVLHDTAGSGSHNDTLYLINDPENRGVSVDYTVEKDGTVCQLNPDVKGLHTNHAGRHTLLRIGPDKYSNAAVNQVTIGIEIVQFLKLQTVPYPGAQLAAIAELCAYLCKTYGLTKDVITTHSAIITDGSRSDPRAFPFPDFWRLFDQYARSGGVDGPAPALAAPVVYQVVEGDTLWKISQAARVPIETIKELNPQYFDAEHSINNISPGWLLTVKP